jgi:glycosyltransferase involved in cell wall biosynthesis
MRVLIDARPALDPRRTGVGVYTQQILRHLPNADPSIDYTAWYLRSPRHLRSRRNFERAHLPNLHEHASLFPAPLFGPLTVRTGVPRLEWTVDFDMMLATNFLPPSTASDDVVLVVHDLAYEHLPETAPHMNERWRRLFDRWVAKARHVIVPSTSTKSDLVATHPVLPERVSVIPLGIDASAVTPAPSDAVDAACRRFGVERPYVLFVGGLEPRKNLDGLIRAFAMLGPDVRLVIAGGPVRWDPENARRLDKTIAELSPATRARVVRTGYVREREKVALLTGATILAYPSLYEGFGLPVLEAFAVGVPVLTSNVSSLPEVAGDAAVMVDPHDPAAIASGIAQLIEDDDLRAMLSAAGLVRAASFPWEATARATAAVLRQSHDGPPA